eukprot:CAMPEP_0171126040 /NCGR_PEP_ID=MMETSP0766_2-20121228/112503_1 /TAXON_ID=439317 /ORGANISM="Gambierdiscus australes, Strain CAWD 149" /LENGTH=454 /DNA_ID=CAMNT_0011589045 /DNA_START=138 /DNA_END=1502 /DNA_ORIENTATION=+
MKGLAASVQHGVSTLYHSASELLADKHHEYREYLDQYMRAKIRDKAVEWMERIPAFIKRQLEDEYMPQFVRRALHTSIDKIWPDIRAELVWELQVFIAGDDELYDEQLEHGSKPDCIRAYLRYHLFPYNRGIWYCLRDPIYVIVNLLAITPVFGIYAFMFLVIWIIIDKSDEYQLVYFILSFKGAQFFSWGVVKGWQGFFMYFKCTTFPTIPLPGGSTLVEKPLCEVAGPGMGTYDFYWLQLTSWLLPLVLVWVSLLLLPCSKEKGRSKLQVLKVDADADADADDVEHGSVAGEVKDDADKRFQRQGGYIRNMLIFDFVVFCVCVALMILIIALQPRPPTGGSKWTKLYNAANNDWQIRQTLFFVQFLYGIFSVVFVPFSIPALQAVLTHSAPTAYNEFGQCCKFKGADKPPREPAVLDHEARQKEAEGVLSNLKKIADGEKSVVKQRSKIAQV